MSYFRELPNLLYQSNLLHKTSSQDYVLIKNLFPIDTPIGKIIINGSVR